eukprot:CAMPEP_0115840246 /NCGR_PEP_ID=MMETSP0287-20121206/6671_1 /TAXON_ID=412157 /ORGANISM="Chrysochromulina rotalis, Strain UIO044" /LENGTH=62 /DNA_ID=CAMNT_0003293849 /DNA_START=218 /DNA_END=402 /DNA_ORIENTATION=-
MSRLAPLGLTPSAAGAGAAGVPYAVPSEPVRRWTPLVLARLSLVGVKATNASAAVLGGAAEG